MTQGDVYTSFYANGVVRDRGPLDASGKPTGRWQLFWPNGRLCTDGAYENGQQQGEWIWRDQYGRVTNTVWCGEQRHEHKPDESTLLPLRVEDLRSGSVGMATVGALVDRFAAARGDDAGESERAAVARELAAAPPEALGVPFTIAAGLPPEQRIHWLHLIAAMPMPDAMPIAEVLDWSRDAICGPAATAVLEAWSRKFAADWQPLIARGNTNPERWSRLHALGLKGFGARPELRRQLVDGGAITFSLGWPLAAIAGVEHGDPLPWVAALDDADAGRRAEAVQILQALLPMDQQVLPTATMLRLLSDPCAAVASGTALLILHRKLELPADQLGELTRSPLAPVRMLAANRLHALGRDAEAETVWRQVAVSEPEAMHLDDGWNQLAEHTRDPAAVRELLLGALEHGGIPAVLALQRVAGEDPRVLEVLVKRAREGPWIRADLLSAEMKRAVQDRLFTLFDDANTPAPQHWHLLENLMKLATDEASRRAVVARGLHSSDPDMRAAALRNMQWAALVPTAAEWRGLLTDAATRQQAASMLDMFPLPEDLDPTPYPVSAVVLAAWADGRPERVALLADRLFAGDAAALHALVLLQADLTPFAARFPHPGPGLAAFWYQTMPTFGQLPDLAAEWRIWQAMQPHPGCAIPMPGSVARPSLPADTALIAAVQRRLADPARRAEALNLMIWLGKDANAILPALRAALPAFTAAELAKLPDVVCAIAPEAAAKLCEPLLDHADPQVAAAVRAGPQSPLLTGQVLRIPGGGSIARKLAERLVADQAFTRTVWFTVLTDAVVALPELRQGLRDHPDSAAIAAAIRDLGPAGDAALPELLAALQARNPGAATALRAVLSPKQKREHLLPLLTTELAGTVGPLLMDVPIEDPAAVATLERLAGDEREPVRTAASVLLAISASDSPVADRARREALRLPQRGLRFVHAKHFARLWPQLTDVERQAVFGFFASDARQTLLPPDLADAIAAAVDSDTSGFAFQALQYHAPLHPAVLERVAAARMFWNPPPRQPEYALPARHAVVLVIGWKGGDAAFRSAALPWLRREPEAAASYAQRLLTAMNEQRLEPLAMLELLEQLGPTASRHAWSWLDDPDLAVRRQALRVVLASAPRMDEPAKWLRGRLRERTWEEQFGPLEGLPPVCAEIANVPSVAERAAALRRLFADHMSEAITATAADLPAARLLLPELRTALRPRWVEHCPAVLGCLRRLGTDAKELLPDVEALAPIPWLHFEVKATARILRGEVEPERAAQRPTERPTGPSTPGPGFRNGWPGPRYR